MGTADAALIARALAGLTAALPEVVATSKTAIDHSGIPVEIDGYCEAMRAAEELVSPHASHGSRP
jgi:hypothetical protein